MLKRISLLLLVVMLLWACGPSTPSTNSGSSSSSSSHTSSGNSSSSSDSGGAGNTCQFDMGDYTGHHYNGTLLTVSQDGEDVIVKNANDKVVYKIKGRLLDATEDKQYVYILVGGNDSAHIVVLTKDGHARRMLNLPSAEKGFIMLDGEYIGAVLSGSESRIVVFQDDSLLVNYKLKGNVNYARLYAMFIDSPAVLLAVDDKQVMLLDVKRGGPAWVYTPAGGITSHLYTLGDIFPVFTTGSGRLVILNPSGQESQIFEHENGLVCNERVCIELKQKDDTLHIDRLLRDDSNGQYFIQQIDEWDLTPGGYILSLSHAPDSTMVLAYKEGIYQIYLYGADVDTTNRWVFTQCIASMPHTLYVRPDGLVFAAFRGTDGVFHAILIDRAGKVVADYKSEGIEDSFTADSVRADVNILPYRSGNRVGISVIDGDKLVKDITISGASSIDDVDVTGMGYRVRYKKGSQSAVMFVLP